MIKGLEKQVFDKLKAIVSVVAPILAAMFAAGKSDEVVAILRSYPSLREFPDNQDLSMLVVVLLGLEFFCLSLVRLTGPWDPGRTRGLYSLAILAMFPIGLWISQSWKDPESEALSRRLLSYRWVSYDPLEFDPDFQPNPAILSIRRDLHWIHQAGFSGIVTFASTGTLQEIPAIAHKEGLAVIMGVWDPKNRLEILSAARQKDSVLGYSVGHDRLGDSYTLTELVTAVQFLRNSSGRPVTTTERVRDYDEPGDQRLSKASDWIFPDVHLSLQESKGPISVERIQKDVEEMMKGIEKVKILSKRLNRPLMLKIVTFPRSGLPGASPDLQREFFQVAIERFHDPYSGLRAGSSFVVSSAFDNQWKRTPPFKPWDRYTGLLSDHGIPFPAGKLVTERWP